MSKEKAAARKKLAPYKKIMKDYLLDRGLELRYGVGPIWRDGEAGVSIRRRTPYGKMVGFHLVKVVRDDPSQYRVCTSKDYPPALLDLIKYLEAAIALRSPDGDK